MKPLLIVTTIFMLWELFKMIFMKSYWNKCVDSGRPRLILLVEVLYFIYLVTLLFTPNWYLSICIFIVSAITAYQVSEDFTDKISFNKKIRNYMITDGIVSILLLVTVFIKIFTN